jgi:hypothetical protein
MFLHGRIIIIHTSRQKLKAKHSPARQGADIQSKVEELEELNQSLRNRDKMKDDAIAQLSDQLLAISTRLQELERKQST